MPWLGLVGLGVLVSPDMFLVGQQVWDQLCVLVGLLVPPPTAMLSHVVGTGQGVCVCDREHSMLAVVEHAPMHLV